MVSVVENDLKDSQNQQVDCLSQTLKDLPDHANEGIVDKNFINLSFFKALGFSQQERIPSFKTSTGHKAVDYALRKNTDQDNFLHT
ncbi:MAG: hypothetical protein AAFO95_20195, partial [Cyanobacteria bacterium J06600_6]